MYKLRNEKIKIQHLNCLYYVNLFISISHVDVFIIHLGANMIWQWSYCTWKVWKL